MKPQKEHKTSSFYLSGSYLSGGAGEYTDGLIINNIISPSQFAVYQYGAREFPLFQLIANAFSNSVLPDLRSEGLENGMRLIKTRSLKFMHWFFPLACVFMLLSKTIYPVVFSENFLPSAFIFNIHLLLLVPRLLFPQTILLAMGKSRVLFLVSLAELALNVVLSIGLGLKYGIAGVAFGTVLAYFLEKLVLISYLKVSENLSFSKYIPLKQLILYSVLLLIFFVLSV
jgi:O-antigen/teichoic acid export membrane protein